MKPLNIFISVITVLVLALFAFGCDKAETVYDCAKVCAGYDKCVDTDFDATKCTENCNKKAMDSDDFAKKVRECEDCIDNQSCMESWPCAVPCGEVVIES